MTKDYTREFAEFCQAMADSMNQNQECKPVTVNEVKSMPEAIDAFLCTLELANLAAKLQ